MDKNQIYEEYHTKILRYIQGKVNDYYLAEDLCSDVFVKVYEKLDTFNEKKASLSTWIFTITRNRLIDYYRTRKVTVEIPESLASEEEDENIDEEDLEKLANSLKKISKTGRAIIVKRYYEGKTLKQIAKEIEKSYVYTKLLHKKALLELRGFFEK